MQVARSVPVQFEGWKLRNILRSQVEPVDVHDQFGRVARRLLPNEAVALALGDTCYFGVGHGKRIRYLRPENTVWLHISAQGSVTFSGTDHIKIAW